MAAAPVVPQVKSLICPNCGGTVTLRGYAQSLNVVCEHCTSVLDARTPTLSVIQQFQAKQKIQPLIPLGSRGTLHGVVFEHIGFQVRAIVVEGVAYRWTEYLLYNPYHGYRYLSEYEGHWNDIKTIQSLPKVAQAARPSAVVGGRAYKHFQSAVANTVYVMGEFPWQVRVGESVNTSDFVSPPFMLSSEKTQGETVWSIGEYTPGSVIWSAFKLQGAAPAPRGVFSNQPNPHPGTVGSIWKAFVMWAALMLFALIAMGVVRRTETVFQQNYTFANSGQSVAVPFSGQKTKTADAAFVTPVFDLKGQTSNVKVEISTNLTNDWANFSFALINEQTGDTYDFGKEVSYYSGSDSDGSWTEGDRKASVTIPSVPPGRYYLRVEPEMDDENAARRLTGSGMSYTLTVKQGAGNAIYFLPAFFLLLIPPILSSMRVMKFENERWSESDYGSQFGTSSSSGGSDD